MAKMREINPTTICKDGTSLSIQASAFHYCSPRDNEGPYTSMEVGYISDANDQRVTPPESWRAHGDGDFPSDVYGWVPVALIEEFIASHGGRADSSRTSAPTAQSTSGDGQ